MNIEDFDKIINDLNNEKKENNKKIDLCDERKRMAKVNQFEYKLGNTLAFSVIPFAILTAICRELISLTGITAFSSFVSILSFPIAMAIPSLAIGNGLRKLMTKKYKTKERYKKFSEAKTETEKLEEEIYYEIEQEKLKNKNQVIEQCINSINCNKLILNSISSKYNVTEKRENLTKEEAYEKVKKLFNLLDKKYEELDVLTAKCILSKKFRSVRSSADKIMNLIGTFGIGGLVPLLIYITPIFLIIGLLKPLSVIQVASLIFTPFVLGGIGVGTYTVKKMKSSSKIFNNLNSKLGENALPNKENSSFEYYESLELEELLSKKIDETVNLQIKLLEAKNNLANTSLEHSNLEKEKTNDKLFDYEFPTLKITKELREDILNHPEKYVGCDVRTRMGMFRTDEEQEKYIQDSLNRPLPGDKPKVKKLGQKTDKK